jgi:glycosyltransferase involved in cell wall biosynthesis
MIAEKPMTISVVIPFLNAEKFLADAVESVFAQTYTDWELLLIDDGSHDSSSSIALTYTQSHPERVRYFRNEFTEGASAARNLGVHNARFDMIAFLDADDLWLRDKLEKQVGILELHAEVAMVYCPLLYVNEHNVESLLIQPMRSLQEGLYLPPLLLGPFLRHPEITPGPQASLLSKQSLLEVGCFEKRFKKVFTDQSLWVKIASRWPIYVQSEPLVRYRQHPASSVAQAISTGTIVDSELDFACWAAKYIANIEPDYRMLVQKDALNRLRDVVEQYIRHHRNVHQQARTSAMFSAASAAIRCYSKTYRECGWDITAKLLLQNIAR